MAWRKIARKIARVTKKKANPFASTAPIVWTPDPKDRPTQFTWDALTTADPDAPAPSRGWGATRWVRNEDGSSSWVSAGLPDMSEIVPRLFVGNFESCPEFEGVRFNVTETPCPHAGCINLNALTYEGEAGKYANLERIEKAAKMVSETLESTNQNVLIHCYVGMERSPLVATFSLMRYLGVGWDDAWDIVKTKRVIAQSRRSWLTRDGPTERRPFYWEVDA